MEGSGEGIVVCVVHVDVHGVCYVVGGCNVAMFSSMHLLSYGPRLVS